MNYTLSSQERFILLYRSALKVGLSREQFGKYVAMQPHSVARKRLKIKDKYGTDLPHLPLTGEYDMVDDTLNDFLDAYNVLCKETTFNNHKIVRNDKKTYIITSAQNATPVHHGFLSAMQQFESHNSGELIIIPYRYRNPNSLWVEKDHDWWTDQVTPYINEQNMELCEGLQLMGHIKMQPTAVKPLSGFDSQTGCDSAIFGHPKVQLATIPTPSRKMPKVLTTTGAVTEPNYTDSKAGHKGSFHHTYSAVVVEVAESGEFHIRHVHGDTKTGEFYDLDKLYTADGVTSGHRIEALITGDTHIEFLDTTVDRATFTNSDSIVNVLRPKYVVYHDLQDFYARNHHHRGDDLLSIGKHLFGRNNVEEGLQQAADFIDRNARAGMTNIIVKSNHDEAFDRWLREGDGKGDPENAGFYHYMRHHQIRNLRKTSTGVGSIDPFKFWCSNPDLEDGLSSADATVFLKRDESYDIKGIEVGFHGDAGPNGSRGSINSLAKIGPKIIIGHSHTPGINEGVYQVGLSAKIPLEYSRGPSSWMHTHCIVYKNGSRTLLNIVNGKWKRTDE